jgi:hypothetical protein
LEASCIAKVKTIIVKKNGTILKFEEQIQVVNSVLNGVKIMNFENAWIVSTKKWMNGMQSHQLLGHRSIETTKSTAKYMGIP